MPPSKVRQYLRRCLPALAAVATLLLSSCHHTEEVVSGVTFRDDAIAMPREYRFADLNGEQLSCAKRMGIREPFATRKAIKRRGLKEISSCADYLVDPLTHSTALLTPKAQRLLRDIGRTFRKELKKAGCREHRIIVTSLLRTREDVTSLRKVNGNAARNSSHMYGTTFDLSYTRYNRISTDGNSVNNATMAVLLGEIISELRADGRCVVIFERNQHCFHITVAK